VDASARANIPSPAGGRRASSLDACASRAEGPLRSGHEFGESPARPVAAHPGATETYRWPIRFRREAAAQHCSRAQERIAGRYVSVDALKRDGPRGVLCDGRSAAPTRRQVQWKRWPRRCSRSALALHGLSEKPAVHQLTTPFTRWRRRRVPRDVELHFAPLTWRDLTYVDGLPVTQVLRTLVDCDHSPMDRDLVDRACARAVELELVDADLLTASRMAPRWLGAPLRRAPHARRRPGP